MGSTGRVVMTGRTEAGRRVTRFVKPATREVVRARVLATTRISPTFVRVTLGGDAVSTISPMGYDQWFRMFFPASGRRGFTLPSATDDRWWPEYQVIPDDERPVLRNFTFRHFRAAGSGTFGDTAEVDVDFASHGDLGPASAWANIVAPGEVIGVLDEGVGYVPDPGAGWQLLMGDESALPAVAGILESVLSDDPAAVMEVFAEVPHPDDLAAEQLATGPNVRVHPLIRADAAARPGVLAVEAVRAATLPTGPGCAFVAGESDLATGVRRHLVRERNWDKSAVTFTGYWKYGKSVY